MLTSAPSPSSSVIHGDRQPALITAIAELTTIRHLAVHGHCGHNACSLIKTMRSPLKTASLDFAPLDRGLRIDVLLRRNPILALAKHSATLEEISGSYFTMLPGEDLVDTVYPSVRTLNATFSSILPPRTLTYVTAFPNLTRLSLSPPVYAGSGPAPDVSSRMERAMSIRLYQRELQEKHVPRQTWTRLEELEGGLTEILTLGLLPCHIPMLLLIGVLSEPLEYDHVKTVLEDTRPAGLAITVRIVDGSTFGDTMGPVFSDPSAQQLCALEIKLVFSTSEGDVDIQEVLNNVAMTLAVLPLHRVAIVLNYGLLIAPHESHQEKPRSLMRDQLG